MLTAVRPVLASREGCTRQNPAGLTRAAVYLPARAIVNSHDDEKLHGGPGPVHPPTHTRPRPPRSPTPQFARVAEGTRVEVRGSRGDLRRRVQGPRNGTKPGLGAVSSFSGPSRDLGMTPPSAPPTAACAGYNIVGVGSNNGTWDAPSPDPRPAPGCAGPSETMARSPAPSLNGGMGCPIR